MNNHYCLLQEESLLHISGPDTLTFLQGQTSCDTRKVDAAQATAGVYCTPQGRVVCDFLLTELSFEHFVLRLRRDIRENAAAVLGKYIVFSKASIDAQRDDWQVVALWGETIREPLTALFGSAPEQQYGCIAGEGFVLLQTDTEGQQFECYLDTQAQPQRLQQLQDTLSAAVENAWQAQQITAGVARIEASTIEEFVPQILNYDLTGHINFEKGCYTGQEVVARLHYRGKPKRRSYLATVSTTEALVTGSPVYTSDQEQSVGNIVNIAQTADATLLLVAATSSGVEKGLRLEGPEGTPLLIGQLPYSVQGDVVADVAAE